MHIPVFYWVTNTLPQAHKDKYSGEVIVFEPRKPVLVSWEIVSTCFGHDDPDKTNCLTRLGWVNPMSDKEQFDYALKRLESFKIEQAHYAPPKGF